MSKQLSKYFTEKELACKCGCGMLPTPQLINQLTYLRELYQKPIIITSGARCSVHNAKVGGAPRSKHLDGIAVDIAADSSARYELIRLALAMGVWGGIGVAKTFLHLDTRSPKEGKVWQY